jgi:hypothetical protein
MKIMLETTDWDSPNVPNHVYVFNDSMTKAFAYVREGTKEVFKFKKPLAIDIRGRTFVDLDDAEPTKTDSDVIEVEGSKGNKYYLSNEGNGWFCSCPGYKYHGTCKHLNLAPKTP